MPKPVGANPVIETVLTGLEKYYMIIRWAEAAFYAA